MQDMWEQGPDIIEPFKKDSGLIEKIEKSTEKEEFMSYLPFFSVLSNEEIKEISSRVKLITCYKDTVIFNEGDRADGVYIVKWGVITLYKIFPGKDEVSDLVILNRGDMIGEMGVVADAPRSLSARVTSGKGELYVIFRDDFLYMMKNYPELSLNLSGILCRRVEEASDRLIKYLSDRHSYIKDREGLEKSRKKSEIIRSISLFHILSEEELHKFSSRIRLLRFERNSLLFSEGDRADALYIVKSGNILLYKSIKEEIRKFANMMKGDIFGETGVISGSRRIFSAEVLSPVAEVYIISKGDFIYMIKNHPGLSLNLSRVFARRIAGINKRLFEIKDKVETK